MCGENTCRGYIKPKTAVGKSRLARDCCIKWFVCTFLFGRKVSPWRTFYAFERGILRPGKCDGKKSMPFGLCQSKSIGCFSVARYVPG
jgi:hypothetical protein